MNIRIWAPRLAFALLSTTAVPAMAADIGATGDQTAFYPDGAGGDLFAASLSLGVKGTF